MTMHLVHPSLSMNGKKKGARKFRNSAQAQTAKDNAESWQNLLSKYDVSPTKKRNRSMSQFKPLVTPTIVRRDRDQPRYPSLPFTAGACARPDDKVYTGDKMIGVAQMSKSNAVPVFEKEHIKEIGRMRRQAAFNAQKSPQIAGFFFSVC